jgi:hypothetical protein
MQMCKLCTDIIIVQIMINIKTLLSIIIYEHEMHLQLYALTFKFQSWKMYYKSIFLNVYFY